jgi:Plavaka transposase
MEPLLDVMEDGINLKCPDGERRYCVPVIASYIADYEEQRVLAGIVSGYCPKCTIPSFVSLKDPVHGLEMRHFDPRIQSEASRLRNALKDDPQELKANGYKSTFPFTEAHPHSDIHKALAPDLLHQVTKCFFDHIHSIVIRLIEARGNSGKAKGEIDARFSHIPPYPKLKSFKIGINKLPRWTGTEYKAMAKVYLGVIKDLIPDECVEMVKHYIDFHRMAHYESHTESTVRLMRTSLDAFWNTLLKRDSLFRKHAVVSTGWYTPKLHYLRHYADFIRQMGSLVHYSTDRTEAWHRPIKDAYRASNRGPQAVLQILTDLDRDFGREMYELRLLAEIRKAGQDNEIENALEGIRGDDQIQNDVEMRSLVQKSVTMRKPQRLKGLRELGGIERDLSLVGLKGATETFLMWVQNQRRNIRKRRIEEPDDNSRRIEATTHKSVHVRYPTVHDPYDAIDEEIYSVDRYTYYQDEHWTKPRYDTVLIRYSNDDGSEDGGHTMRNRRVGRVCLFFKLETPFRTTPYCLAFVQMFSCGSAPDRSCGMYKVKKLEKYEVIEVETIERGVHLIPSFGASLSTDMADGGSPPALDLYETFWLNNQVDLHIFNTVW